MRYRLFVVIVIILMSLQACHESKPKNSYKVVTVESTPVKNTLYYSGTIRPKRTMVVATPAEGVVIEMPFQYGEEVHKDQLLFVISSTKFMNDYKTAFMNYIKTKNEFNTAQMQVGEAKFLHKHSLISEDDFKMKQSSFYASQLALLQAKDALENLVRQLNMKQIDFYNLSITDIDKITKAMHLKMNSQSLRIYSPTSGIILSPLKSDDDNKKIVKGDTIKENDALAVIGDMNGLSIRIKVNELVVNELRPGQQVRVTGIAFPDLTLRGEITKVDRQGESSGGGLPVFLVEVEVPSINKEQQKIIHAGMSAKVEIDIEQEAQLTLPIAAIKEKNGASFVELFDENNKKTKEIPVVTGKTTQDRVTIVSGLKVGDKIGYTYKA